MPQPFSSIRKAKGFNFGPNAITKRPKAAIRAIDALARWSYVESQYGHLLSLLLQSDYAIGMAMFQALTSAAAQRASLSAAANEALPAEDVAILRAINKFSSSAASARNSFAHHLWGWSDDVLDGLLLLDPKYTHEWSIRERQLTEHMKKNPSDVEYFFNNFRKIDRSTIMVWRKPDFDSLSQSISILSHLLSLFMTYLRCEEPLRGAMRTELLRQPQVAQALQPLYQTATQ